MSRTSTLSFPDPSPKAISDCILQRFPSVAEQFLISPAACSEIHIFLPFQFVHPLVRPHQCLNNWRPLVVSFQSDFKTGFLSDKIWLGLPVLSRKRFFFEAARWRYSDLTHSCHSREQELYTQIDRQRQGLLRIAGDASLLPSSRFEAANEADGFDNFRGIYNARKEHAYVLFPTPS